MGFFPKSGYGFPRFKRKDYQYKLANKLCDMAGTIFLEDIDFRTMAKGF
ncbi:hypothetical protein MC7420_7340 [Coleofasciculus chthonoplastes PCC 7420]|uniref:Uncharacterized protein n=1 Tax=Coleofasciculus chthonoplastes PCC 7420 TaxID=118168 RepID=B4VHR8_9CYAN|nr:hypothetical protein MC7420_7340 [Coleofasciculus chthonoplastes PCC 7420]